MNDPELLKKFNKYARATQKERDEFFYFVEEENGELDIVDIRELKKSPNNS